jgi:RNase P subunit RPR2
MLVRLLKKLWPYTDSWYSHTVKINLRCRECTTKLIMNEAAFNVVETMSVVGMTCPECGCGYSVQVEC